MSGYFKNIGNSVQTLSNGLKLTMQHLWEAKSQREPLGVENDDYFKQDTGLFTVQYPYEELPVPDNGRYKLHNEIEDCIVCDKCAKICPVNCIDIEPVRATEEFGKTSDGTSKRIYAAKFDIDMSKCCFCGLCTTVCPTECLTMTKEFDFSTDNIADHTFQFGNMTEDLIEEKKKEFELFQAKKEEKIAKQSSVKAAGVKPKIAQPSASGGPKPMFRPKVKSVPKPNQEADPENKVEKPKPKFRPKVKPAVKPVASADQKSEEGKPKFRPKIKPVMKPKEDKKGESKPIYKPSPIVKKKPPEGNDG
ncbi:MAG: 4Fe-4S dicluster domain-containing protein [Cyclobacteriaceae bacterium]